MPDIFKDYAAIYDIIYKDKDYSGECYFLEKIFKKYSKKPVRDILDVACGTGNHAIPLASEGFNVFAQDMSSQMLSMARKKARERGLKIKFMGCLPMQRFRHRRKFDAVIAMFSSIDYMVKLSDLKNTLKNVRASIRPGGIFVFDFWNKDCVVKAFTPFKKVEFRDGKHKVVRISRVSLNKNYSVAVINYTCDYFISGKHSVRIKELHKMKYYNIPEMVKILNDNGFCVLACFPFMGLGKKIKDSDWNISVVVTPQNK